MAETVGSGFLAGYTDGGDDFENGSELIQGGPACPDPDLQADLENQDDDACPFIPVDIMRPEPDPVDQEPDPSSHAPNRAPIQTMDPDEPGSS